MFNVILSNNLDQHKCFVGLGRFSSDSTTLYCVIVKLQLPT